MLIVVQFFNLRSFDRIAITEKLLDRAKISNIGLKEADLALDDQMTGQGDSGRDFAVTPRGDPMTIVTKRADEDPSTAKPLQDEIAGGNELDTAHTDSTTHKGAESSKILVEAYSGAAEAEIVPATIAGYAMEASGDVSDRGNPHRTRSKSDWIASDINPVQNFVSEELYIHSKVYLLTNPTNGRS